MNPADWIVWRLVRNVKPGDRIVVGVGTPLALCAAVIGRELHYDVQLVVGGAYQPHLADIASAVNRPEQLPGLSHGVLGQEMLLEHVQRGAFSLQFVSPAQVDARGRLNTVAVAGRRWLAGPLAIPDVSVGVQRLIGYRAEHSRRVLVDRVDHVTGAGTG